jgi:deazaflavin-dependent oxidoreductase (nitroreductase family)
MRLGDTLRFVDPNTPRGAVYRTWAALVASRFGFWLSSHIGWRVDPYLLRLTGGRLGTGLIIPTALLETRGARSGRVRRNGVIYFNDGERVIIVASKAGAPENPSWFHNARTNPEVRLNGLPFQAEVVPDEGELARLWQLADRVFPPFSSYRRRAGQAGRSIPILRLSAPDQPPA